MQAVLAVKQVRRLKLGQTRRFNEQNRPALLYQRFLDVLHEFGLDPGTMLLRMKRIQIQITHLVRHHLWGVERNADMAITAFFVSEPVFLARVARFVDGDNLI
jgi:hypothetical protein